jgi:hypothetical protein
MGYFAVNEASSERARNPRPIVPRHKHDARFHRSGVGIKLQPLGSLTAVDVGNRFHRWCRSKFFTLSVGAGFNPAGISSAVVAIRTTDLLALIACSL